VFYKSELKIILPDMFFFAVMVCGKEVLVNEYGKEVFYLLHSAGQ